MEKLCLFLIFGILSNEALGMSFRNKRQSMDNNDENLEDRNGFNRLPQGQGQLPNQGQSPNQGQLPNQGQQTTQQPNTGSGNTDAASLSQSSAYQDCIRRCPVTSEYNPVCGTDSVTYDNPGRLGCAQNCGMNVTQSRTSRCPSTTAAPPTS